jgi:dihydrolipoamide dehydrogenase
MKQYDAVVIGAGPGGYEAALELADSGLKVLLVDRNKERIGGTCLNEGCITSKSYLQSAQYLSKASFFNDCGVMMDVKGLDIKRLREKTLSLKDEIRSGVFWLLEQAGVETLYGLASFVDANTIEVSNEKIGFGKCIIATGSQVRELAHLPLDKKKIISSKEVFELEELPASIIIIGGGPIGCEFATFFNAVGVEVTQLVRGEQLLSSEDEDVSKALLRAFKKRDIKVMTSAIVQKAEIDEKGVRLLIEAEMQEQYIQSDLVLCATGRTPYIEGLFPEKAGVELDEKGFVKVNAAFQTAQKHIYSIGDCIDTYAFAHTAYAEAKIAAHNIISGEASTNTHITPSTTFTDPAIASCGLKEKEAAAWGRAIEVKKAVYKVNAKAKILGDDSGFAKIIVCAESGVILGASIIGMDATEIIHELIVAIEKKLTAKELKEMIHAHPTVSEIIRYL